MSTSKKSQDMVMRQVEPGNKTNKYHIILGNLPFNNDWRDLKEWLDTELALASPAGKKSEYKIDHAVVLRVGTGWVRMKGVRVFEATLNILENKSFEGRAVLATADNRTKAILIPDVPEGNLRTQSSSSQQPNIATPPRGQGWGYGADVPRVASPDQMMAPQYSASQSQSIHQQHRVATYSTPAQYPYHSTNSEYSAAVNSYPPVTPRSLSSGGAYGATTPQHGASSAYGLTTPPGAGPAYGGESSYTNVAYYEQTPPYTNVQYSMSGQQQAMGSQYPMSGQYPGGVQGYEGTGPQYGSDPYDAHNHSHSSHRASSGNAAAPVIYTEKREVIIRNVPIRHSTKKSQHRTRDEMQSWIKEKAYTATAEEGYYDEILQIVSEHRSGDPNTLRGYVIVRMASAKGAERMVEVFDGVVFDGRTLRVELGKEETAVGVPPVAEQEFVPEMMPVVVPQIVPREERRKDKDREREREKDRKKEKSSSSGKSRGSGSGKRSSSSSRAKESGGRAVVENLIAWGTTDPNRPLIAHGSRKEGKKEKKKSKS